MHANIGRRPSAFGFLAFGLWPLDLLKTSEVAAQSPEVVGPNINDHLRVTPPREGSNNPLSLGIVTSTQCNPTKPTADG